MTKSKLNIVFWGENSFSNIILESLINDQQNVKLVVIPNNEDVSDKLLVKTCTAYGIPFLRVKNINTEFLYNEISAVSPDLCVIAHIGKLIKRPILDIPSMGFINLHPSLLPKYRGMVPEHMCIMNGEKETGVSVHYVNEGIDTGDIILQKKIKLDDNDYVSDLLEKWKSIYPQIMVEAIHKIIKGDPTIKQSPLEGSYYSRFKDNDWLIDLSQTTRDVFNFIRAVSYPYHGAQIGDYIIYRAHVLEGIETIDYMNKYRIGAYFEKVQNPFLRLKDGVLFVDDYIEY